MIEDALSTIPEVAEESEFTDSTPTEHTTIHQVDKEINNVPVMKSKNTQYRVSHFRTETSILPSTSAAPLFVKLPQKKKNKDAAVNTTISFKPDDMVLSPREAF